MAAATTATTATAHTARKSVENTVFVRFVPANEEIRRHHVQDFFSEIGPIKKSSVIHNNGSVYGFVKFTNNEDASLAAVQLNNRQIKINSKNVTVKVERAQTSPTVITRGGGSSPSSTTNRGRASGDRNSNNIDDERTEKDENSLRKKTSRLMLRNLSFYATEKDCRKALSIFGELTEVHIPTVTQNGKTIHRGFGFVTFADSKAANKCLKTTSETSMEIRGRPVEIARSLHKTAYESLRHGNRKPNSGREKDEADTKKTESRDQEQAHDNDDSQEDEDDKSEDEEEEAEEDKKEKKHDTTSVAEKRCLFVRNLPFDSARHDVFEAFREFGYITTIYLVRDKETGKIPKGTAFVSFQKQEQATRALETASSGDFVEQRSADHHQQQQKSEQRFDATTTGIVLKGRRLLVDLAVDKGVASTLTVAKSQRQESSASGKDKRNLYLKGEGRVDNDESSKAWDELPETDKFKRQSAWSEKNTKLRSPLFFINPVRLSIRNLAKHIDEAALKKVCVQATLRGLERNLVTPRDQIAHWKASGEITTREILSRIQQAEDNNLSIVPNFDTKNIKHHIPSIHVHRDYAPGGNKQMAPSRGFAFIEFDQHVFALACLRELNNNTAYSEEFAAGGKQAVQNRQRRAGKKGNKRNSDNDVLVPRLIVEFTVENKVKAKQQAEHRAQQKTNFVKQKEEHKTKHDNDDNSKKRKEKKRRGAAQRERKRHHVDGDGEAKDPSPSDRVSTTEPSTNEAASKIKKVRPHKKQKVDKSEQDFSKLVESYKRQAVAIIGSGEQDVKKEGNNKRWFD